MLIRIGLLSMWMRFLLQQVMVEPIMYQLSGMNMCRLQSMNLLKVAEVDTVDDDFKRIKELNHYQRSENNKKWFLCLWTFYGRETL